MPMPLPTPMPMGPAMMAAVAIPPAGLPHLTNEQQQLHQITMSW
jgi:hypothetical protein